MVCGCRARVNGPRQLKQLHVLCKAGTPHVLLKVIALFKLLVRAVGAYHEGRGRHAVPTYDGGAGAHHSRIADRPRCAGCRTHRVRTSWRCESESIMALQGWEHARNAKGTEHHCDTMVIMQMGIIATQWSSCKWASLRHNGHHANGHHCDTMVILQQIGVLGPAQMSHPISKQPHQQVISEWSHRPGTMWPPKPCPMFGRPCLPGAQGHNTSLCFWKGGDVCPHSHPLMTCAPPQEFLVRCF
eukprot:scaffold38690_cov23-Tisochrysis_lutea.AAC.2